MDIVRDILKMLSCSDMIKYVLNDCELHSKCSDCCDFDIKTNKVDIPEEVETKPDLSIGLGEFLHVRKTYSKNNDK